MTNTKEIHLMTKTAHSCFKKIKNQFDFFKFFYGSNFSISPILNEFITKARQVKAQMGIVLPLLGDLGQNECLFVIKAIYHQDLQNKDIDLDNPKNIERINTLQLNDYQHMCMNSINNFICNFNLTEYIFSVPKFETIEVKVNRLQGLPKNQLSEILDTHLSNIVSKGNKDPNSLSEDELLLLVLFLTVFYDYDPILNLNDFGKKFDVNSLNQPMSTVVTNTKLRRKMIEKALDVTDYVTLSNTLDEYINFKKYKINYFSLYKG